MKQLLTTLVVLFISSALFIACNDKTTTSTNEEIKPTFDIPGAKKIIDSTNAAFSALVAKGDSAGLAALYTTDAKVMMPNMPSASGRSQIQSGFGGMFAAMGPIDLRLTAVDVWGNDDMVIEEGSYVMSKEGKEIDRAKYIVLWKMEDGKWKLFRDIFNSDNPPVPPGK